MKMIRRNIRCFEKRLKSAIRDGSIYTLRTKQNGKNYADGYSQIDGFVQDFIADALELLQSCTKPSNAFSWNNFCIVINWSLFLWIH